MISHQEFKAALQSSRADGPVRAEYPSFQQAAPSKPSRTAGQEPIKYPTVTAYRGPGAVALPGPHKNQADHASQLSPTHLESAPPRPRGLSQCDVTRLESSAIACGRGSFFEKQTAGTKKGWRHGKF